MRAIDGGEIVGAYVAGAYRHEPGRVDLTAMAHEDEAITIVHAAAAADRVVLRRRARRRRSGSPRGALALQHHAAVVRRGRGLDVEARRELYLVQSLEHRFQLVRGRQLAGMATPGGDDDEHRPERDVELAHQRNERLDVADIVA